MTRCSRHDQATHPTAGDLQLRILQVLWEHGDSSVSGVHESLGKDPRLAYTTVATMRKMEARGLARHRVEDRRFIYRAAVKAEEIARSMVDTSWTASSKGASPAW